MLTLTKISENATTITLGWTAPPDAQVYCFYANGVRVSTGTALYTSGSQKGQPRQQVQFGKTGAPYEVAAMCRDAAGVFRVELGKYPAAPVPPAAGGKRASTLHYQNYQPSIYRYGDGDLFICGEWAAKQAAIDLTIPVFAYSDLTTAQDAFFTGVTKAQVLNNNWAAKHNGQPIVNNTFGSVVVDHRIQAYRQAQLDAILAKVKNDDKAEGVFFDDCMYDPRPICNGVTPDGFTLQSWHDAMLGSIQFVAAGCRAAGLKVIGNCGWYAPGDARSDNGQLAQIWGAEMAAHMDWVMLEYGAQVPPGSLMEGGYERIRGAGPEWYNNYDGHCEGVIRAVEGAGASYLGLASTPNGDSAQAVYAKATVLLFADRPGSTCTFWCHDEQAPLTALLRTDMGAPKGPMTKSGGVYRREFANGSVEVQPGPRTAKIALAGGQSASATLDDAPIGLSIPTSTPKPDFSAFRKPTK